jgi:flagellar motor switch protein FliN/FliY
MGTEDKTMDDKAAKMEGDAPSRRLELLLDVPLDLSVELGRTRMSIQDLLSLGPGSVVELDKIAGEPLDILVNSRLVARGEVVVVNDKFGVRITDIVSPSERIAKLR